MLQNRWRLGLCPRPRWGSLQRSPRPPRCDGLGSRSDDPLHGFSQHPRGFRSAPDRNPGKCRHQMEIRWINVFCLLLISLLATGLITSFVSRITRITRIHPCRHNRHGWPSAGEKSLKLINTPSHSPNDGQASPCLNSIPLIILSSSLVPYYALYFLILSYTCSIIHRFLISPSVPASLGTCFSLSFPIQS